MLLGTENICSRFKILLIPDCALLIDSMKKAKKDKRVLSLFDKEAVRKIKKNKFSGRLMVLWENGIIKDMTLNARVGFWQGRREFFMEEM